MRNNYPLLCNDDLLYHISSLNSNIDLRYGYHMLKIRASHIPKTTICTRYGHNEFLIMSFRLTNARETFMELMNLVFQPYLGCYVIVFIDDILVRVLAQLCGILGKLDFQ